MAKLLFVIMDDPNNLSESIRAAHALHYAVELGLPVIVVVAKGEK